MRPGLLHVVSLLLPALAHAAGAHPPTLDADSPVGLWIGVAADPDATSTEVVEVAPGRAARTLAALPHAAGAAPRGSADPATGELWLVLADSGPPG